MRTTSIEAIGGLVALIFMIIFALTYEPIVDDQGRHYDSQRALNAYNAIEDKSEGLQLCLFDEAEEGQIDREDVAECVYEVKRYGGYDD